MSVEGDKDLIGNRDDLSSRELPFMTLSSGSPSSKTQPPLPAHNAKQRFQVTGTAVVTGGTGTLGLTASRALLQHGLSNLMILDINVSNAAHIIVRLRTDFPDAKIEARSVDVTDEVAVKTVMEETTQLMGSINILLCFAGVVGCTHSLTASIPHFRRLLEINTTGTFICAQAAAQQMVKQGTGGSIVFVASISAHRVNFPQPQAAYNASKAALLSLKSSLAAEWAVHGIRVNSISPGYMDTILNEGGGKIAEARGMWASKNPFGRMGTPDELSGVVVMLASQAGNYVNGTDIVVDGGGLVF